MEIGRVALVNYGEDYGKLVVIVDVIDQNRVCLPLLFFTSFLASSCFLLFSSLGTPLGSFSMFKLLRISYDSAEYLFSFARNDMLAVLILQFECYSSQRRLHLVSFVRFPAVYWWFWTRFCFFSFKNFSEE